MMRVISKWKIFITFADGKEVTFWINEDHPSNVLRKIAELQFNESGLEQPNYIAIKLC